MRSSLFLFSSSSSFPFSVFLPFFSSFSSLALLGLLLFSPHLYPSPPLASSSSSSSSLVVEAFLSSPLSSSPFRKPDASLQRKRDRSIEKQNSDKNARRNHYLFPLASTSQDENLGNRNEEKVREEGIRDRSKSRGKGKSSVEEDLLSQVEGIFLVNDGSEDRDRNIPRSQSPRNRRKISDQISKGEKGKENEKEGLIVNQRMKVKQQHQVLGKGERVKNMKINDGKNKKTFNNNTNYKNEKNNRNNKNKKSSSRWEDPTEIANANPTDPTATIRTRGLKAENSVNQKHQLSAEELADLPPEIRRLILQPPKSLEELMQEAHIDESVPDLILDTDELEDDLEIEEYEVFGEEGDNEEAILQEEGGKGLNGMIEEQEEKLEMKKEGLQQKLQFQTRTEDEEEEEKEETAGQKEIDNKDHESEDSEGIRHSSDYSSLNFRAGFVTIVGSPNVGKSTLLNTLVGERLSIISSKSQTTRHQICGIVTGEDHQIVYYDTPGVLKPDYKLQEGMMAFVKDSLSDADVTLFVVDLFEDPWKILDYDLLKNLQYEGNGDSDSESEFNGRPLIIAINKVDLLPSEENPQGHLGREALEEVGSVDSLIHKWQTMIPRATVVPISAATNTNITSLIDTIKGHLPPSPPLFPNDTLTNHHERFFASEMIREQIFSNYDKEIPYSCEVSIEAFKEMPRLLRIEANINVARETQKGIVIGHRGQKLKRIGTEARKEMEAFFGKKVYLELRVVVRKDWRLNELDLKRFGYM